MNAPYGIASAPCTADDITITPLHHAKEPLASHTSTPVDKEPLHLHARLLRRRTDRFRCRHRQHSGVLRLQLRRLGNILPQRHRGCRGRPPAYGEVPASHSVGSRLGSGGGHADGADAHALCRDSRHTRIAMADAARGDWRISRARHRLLPHAETLRRGGCHRTRGRFRTAHHGRKRGNRHSGITLACADDIPADTADGPGKAARRRGTIRGNRHSAAPQHETLQHGVHLTGDHRHRRCHSRMLHHVHAVAGSHRTHRMPIPISHHSVRHPRHTALYAADKR